MKKLLSLFTLLAFFAIPQSAFAWSYDGLGSLNPFTNFGRGFGNSECGCQRPKLTKCEKLHGVKIKRTTYYEGQPCGCAAPVIIEPVMDKCPNCHRAF
jgi:hypothetical protein